MSNKDKLCPIMSQVLETVNREPYLYEVFCYGKNCVCWDTVDKVCSLFGSKETLDAIYYLLNDIAKGRQ